MATIAAIVAISNNIKTDKRMTAIGLACTGGAVGIMICPPVAEQLIEHFGWRGAMVLVGAANANLVTCGMLMRPKKSPPTYRPIEPSDIPIDNQQRNGNYLILITKWAQICCEPFQVLVKRPVFTAILAARVFTTIAYSGWAIFLVPHAIEKGLSSSKAALLSSIGGIATIFGKLIPGLIVDSGFMSATQLSVLTLLANTAAYTLDYWSYSFWSLSLAALINGFNFGSDFVLLFPLCFEVLGHNDVIDGFGLSFIPGSTGAIVGGLLIGKYILYVVLRYYSIDINKYKCNMKPCKETTRHVIFIQYVFFFFRNLAIKILAYFFYIYNGT